jgi:hypothetical protein
MAMFDDFGQTPSGGPLRALIAEDETIIRLDLRGMLEKHGLIVAAEARNGAEAVDLARTTESRRRAECTPSGRCRS